MEEHRLLGESAEVHVSAPSLLSNALEDPHPRACQWAPTDTGR